MKVLTKQFSTAREIKEEIIKCREIYGLVKIGIIINPGSRWSVSEVRALSHSERVIVEGNSEMADALQKALFSSLYGKLEGSWYSENSENTLSLVSSCFADCGVIIKLIRQGE